MSQMYKLACSGQILSQSTFRAKIWDPDLAPSLVFRFRLKHVDFDHATVELIAQN